MRMRRRALKEELRRSSRKIADGVIAGAAAGARRRQVGGDGGVCRWLSAPRSRAGWRLKALGSSTDAIGGYAVPRGNRRGDRPRRCWRFRPSARSPMSCKVGSAGYRKLITNGGTPSGWVGYRGGAARDRDADVYRDRAAGGRALRQSGGVAADAGRCDVRRRGLAGRARSRPSSRGPRAWRSSRAPASTSRWAS